MSNYTYGGTISTGGQTFALTSTESGSRPEKTPAGLINTRAVQAKDGWLGQIIVDKTIVFETSPQPDSDEAIDAANTRMVAAIAQLFAETAPVIEAGGPDA